MHTPDRKGIASNATLMHGKTTTPVTTKRSVHDDDDGDGFRNAIVATPTTAAETGQRADSLGLARRTKRAMATPESTGKSEWRCERDAVASSSSSIVNAVRTTTAKRSESRALANGFESPERRREGASENARFRERDECENASASTPPASPTERVRVCPQTPMKAHRTRTFFAGEEESRGGERARARPRVARSLLEEFEAAERSLEDMSARRDSAGLKNASGDDFDPFDEPSF